MTDKDAFERQLIRAPTALALKQSKTAFWKTGVAIVASASGTAVAIAAFAGFFS